MHRDIGYYWMRLAIYMGIGVCLGTIFYQVGYSYSSIQVIKLVNMIQLGLYIFCICNSDNFSDFAESM